VVPFVLGCKDVEPALYHHPYTEAGGVKGSMSETIQVVRSPWKYEDRMYRVWFPLYWGAKTLSQLYIITLTRKLTE
jgi:hypothetical protein